MSLESLLQRDKQITLLALLLITTLSWWYLFRGAGMGVTAWEMTRMPAGMALAPVAGTGAYLLLMFLMWWIMMIAMMLPGATPVILLAAALNRRSEPGRRPYGSTACFVGGYLLAWAGFSILAVIAQWLLQTNNLLSARLMIDQSLLAALFLMVAALWQMTFVKQACLRHCRTPVQFLTQHRRPGHAGALLMGAEHGLYCLGCCWMLMALLFVGGIMDLIWIAGLSIYVLAEKLLPDTRWLNSVTVIMLVAAGLYTMSLPLWQPR